MNSFARWLRRLRIRKLQRHADDVWVKINRAAAKSRSEMHYVAALVEYRQATLALIEELELSLGHELPTGGEVTRPDNDGRMTNGQG